MVSHNVVIGQRIDPRKAERARELRRKMTPEEAILWNCLRANRLHGLQFRRQQVIDGLIVDFYCHSAGTIIEVDGGVHEQQADYDRERDLILARRGLHVLRVKNDEVRENLGQVLSMIAEACRQ